MIKDCFVLEFFYGLLLFGKSYVALAIVNPTLYSLAVLFPLWGSARLLVCRILYPLL